MKSNSIFWEMLIFSSVVLASLFYAQPAAAGKVEIVKLEVQQVCKKEIPEDKLMDAVIAAFDCTPGADVTVVDCVIKCRKENKGKVVGK